MALRLSETEIKSEHGRQLIEWLRPYKGSYGTRIHIVENTEDSLRLKLYMARNYYTIVAKPSSSGDIYLGCVASTRAPRPGEDWTRGNDLPDGIFSKALAHKILSAIVFYEALEVAKDIECPQVEEKWEPLAPKGEVAV